MFVQLESRRRRQAPWATALLVLACVATFVWLASTSADVRRGFLSAWGTVPTALFDTQAGGWMQWADLRFARLLTALFIHADWIHLTTNLLFLVIFGIPTERALGAGRFLVLFLLVGALANLVGALTLATVNAPIIGSSGAVSGIVGAYLALYPRARLGLVLPLGLFLEFVRVPAPLLIGFWVIVQILFTYVGPSFGAVAWWTHLSGYIIGFIVAVLWRPALARRARA